MKATLEMPDALFRRAKATAAEWGLPLNEFLTNAVREYLRRSRGDSSKGKRSAAPPPAWMSAFGGLRGLHKETIRINRIVEQEFEQIEETDWR